MIEFKSSTSNCYSDFQSYTSYQLSCEICCNMVIKELLVNYLFEIYVVILLIQFAKNSHTWSTVWEWQRKTTKQKDGNLQKDRCQIWP